MADIKKEFNKTKDAFYERKEGLSDALSDTMEEAKAKAGDDLRAARVKATRYVQSNPEKSVMIAAGIGVAVGMIMAGIFSCKNGNVK